jgi:adenylate cyclase
MSNNIKGIAEDGIDTLDAWLTKAGLRGEPETALVSGFRERAVAAGLPLSRAQVLKSTKTAWSVGGRTRAALVHEYGRAGWPEDISDLHLSSRGEQTEVVARWRASPFFPHVADRGQLAAAPRYAESEAEFPVMRDYRATGMTDYITMINRLAPEGIIGEMDCVYSSWVTTCADGFPMAILQRSRAWSQRLHWRSRRPRSRASPGRWKPISGATPGAACSAAASCAA